MAKAGIPGYHGFRIYLSSSILFFFLVMPFFTFMVFQNASNLSGHNTSSFQDAVTLADSLNLALESLQDLNEEEIDSLKIKVMDFSGKKESGLGPESVDTGEAKTEGGNTAGAMAPGEIIAGDIARAAADEQGVSEKELPEAGVKVDDDGPFSTYFLLLFFLTLASYLAGFIYNRRFKRYFKLRRRGKEIPEPIQRFCKKQLFQTPLVNAVIVIMPLIVILAYSLFAIVLKANFQGEAEIGLFTQLLYLTLLATLLEFLFVYYWQRHRVHINYIEHFYSETELRKQVFRRKGGKIRNRLLAASGMATFLPLIVVMGYLILSLTQIKDLDIDKMSPGQQEILVGPLIRLVNPGSDFYSSELFGKLFYVNVLDSAVMLVGIAGGIIVSLIYLLLFIKWTNQDITRPVKELLATIRETRGGEGEHYTIVRTNDEIGELAEGYNEMTRKINDYLESISRMNRDLEKTVKERTNEVVMQKEEIEAQKEEIEAQLDMATLQRDTIARQKEKILDSIRYAERIQSAILPPVEYLSEILSDHFVIFKPRDIVSGDFYWTSRKDDKIMIAVADCTGHGVPGAFLSMLGISFLNEIVNRREMLHPNEILDHFRDYVIKSLHQTGTKGEAQDGLEIAFCIIDTRKKHLEFAGANRPLYLVRRNASAGAAGNAKTGHELVQVDPDRMPIGIYEQELRPYTNHRIKLKKGDSLYMLSDGYVDQLGGPRRKTYRSKHFKQLLLEIQFNPMKVQKKILMDKLNEWQGSIEQIDDILVVGVKI